VEYTKDAMDDLNLIEKNNLGELLICMAKTQLSLSDNPKQLGRPDNFSITIRNIRISNGAGFLVPLAGNIMTMPGLPKHPQAFDMDVLSDGTIVGL
ncbi:MAG: formate--tetrahydrofolate ligase, partial [Caldisericaceae bacterium]